MFTNKVCLISLIEHTYLRVYILLERFPAGPTQTVYKEMSIESLTTWFSELIGKKLTVTRHH